MINELKLSEAVRNQISNYSQKLTLGLKKPLRKFVAQMLFGILATKDVKLSNIARSLGEMIPLIKTENRLSRQTKSRDITEELTRPIINNGVSWVKDDTVLAVDISDLTKEYATKMEYLAMVRDGSCGGDITKGYWLIEIVAADVRGVRLVPLLMKLYSQQAEDFKSENTQILTAIDSVRAATKGKGILAIDRGGDRKSLIGGLLGRRARFVIRLVGNRNLLDRHGNLRLALTIANRMSCQEAIEVVIENQGKRERHRVWVGRIKVKLPGRKEILSLVVVKGFGKKPMMLLTNEVEKSTEEVLEIYLTRWKCEESYRFLKSGYNLEDVRVRSYVGLRNIVALILAVFHFLAVYLGERFQVGLLLRKILERAKRFFQIPEFKFYAMADGVCWILVKGGHGPPRQKKVRDTSQLMFSFSK